MCALGTLAIGACYSTHEVVEAAAPEPTTPTEEPPEEIAGLTHGLVQLALGGDHSCALHESGRVACWGDNGSGQLGLDRREYPRSSSPVWVPGLNDVVRLGAGDDHTCALRSDESVVCWGENHGGQLGPAATGLPDSDDPRRIPAVSSAIDLAAGGGQSCVIHDSGDASCWGKVPGRPEASWEEVLPIPALRDVTQIAVHANHGCALRRGGSVVCWGANALPLGGLDSVIEVASGRAHSCAVRSNGEVYCWGQNRNGELGTSEGDGNEQASPTRLGNLADAVSIAAGVGYTCALRETGAVRCWGRNHGNGESTSAANDFPGIQRGEAIVAGGRHACVIESDGAVRCWGANASGQLGDGTRQSRGEPVRVRLNF